MPLTKTAHATASWSSSSRDLSLAHYATGIAHRLQQVLDDWNFLSPQLQDLYDTLNQRQGARHAFPFDPRQCMAPLPRAYQWANGSAYLNHVELVRKARGAECRQLLHDPLHVPGRQRRLFGSCDDVRCASEADGIDFEAEVAVITGDVRHGRHARRRRSTAFGCCCWPTM